MAEDKRNLIDVTQTIIVGKNVDVTFEYFSDLRLDHLWRKEINETAVSNPFPKTGSIAIEDSVLSRWVPHYIRKLRCTEFIENSRIVYQTLPGDPFFLESSREVEAVSASQTKVTYRILFDKSIVKFGLQFNLPAFVVAYVTRRTMNNYLRQLRSLIESRITTHHTKTNLIK